MPPSNGSFWSALGHAVREAVADLPNRVTQTPRSEAAEAPSNGSTGSRYAAGLVAGGAAALIAALIAKQVTGRRPTTLRMARGALAGAGAAVLVLGARALMASKDDENRSKLPDVLDELLSGAGRGLVYAAVIDPYLPGAPLLKGALAGTADYLAAPHGGLFHRLERLSPIHRVPAVSALLEIGSSEQDPYLAHLCRGALLGLLCGRGSKALRDGREAES
ncbi:MAG: hypothetical protein EXR92_05130 [Gemmatimonadetes bacterium]|nr:hypothetical protein [Gemmatimonadota bacterium]